MNLICNCLFWVLYKKITQGGVINYYKSKTWKGFHATWSDANGQEWEYTLKKIKKQPWWYIPFCYEGIVKKVKK